MFERYTEDARQVISSAREEASRVGSSYLESEHLLLGVMRSGEVELNELLKLKDLENVLRAELETAQPDITANRDISLSNQSKRILAYAAEEAIRLDSMEISSGHLLLGILREPESIGSRVLLANNVDLLRTREMLAMVSRSSIGDTRHSGRPPKEWASTASRRYWIAGTVQLAPLILLGVGVVTSTVTGRDLLVIAAIWFVASLAWHIRGPSSFFWNLGKRDRSIAVAASYAIFLLLQLLMFGWLVPLSVGIYRVTMR